MTEVIWERESEPATWRTVQRDTFVTFFGKPDHGVRFTEAGAGVQHVGTNANVHALKCRDLEVRKRVQ